MEFLEPIIILFNFLKEDLPVFHSLCCVVLPLAMPEGFNSCTFSQILVISVFDNSHPNGCEVVSHSGFDLQFPKG